MPDGDQQIFMDYCCVQSNKLEILRNELLIHDMKYSNIFTKHLTKFMFL